MSTPDDAVVTPVQPTVPNRVLDVGDIVSGAFRTVRAAPAIFLGLPLLLVVPGLLLALVIVALAGTSVATDGAARSGTGLAAVLAGVLGGLAMAYAAVRVSGATTIGAYQVALGARPSLPSLWRAAGGIVWRLLALVILGFLVMLVVTGVIGAIITAIAAAGHEGWAVALMFVLFILALPLYAVLAVKLTFVAQVVALKKAGPIAAAQRSWALTRGQWWPTLGRLVLLYVLAIPISVVTQIAVVPAAVMDPGNAQGLTWAMLPAIAIMLVLAFLYGAYSAAYLTLMYLDARRREEAIATLPAASGYGPQLAYPGGTLPPPQGVSPYAAPPLFGQRQPPSSDPYPPAASAGTAYPYGWASSPDANYPPPPVPQPAPPPGGSEWGGDSGSSSGSSDSGSSSD